MPAPDNVLPFPAQRVERPVHLAVASLPIIGTGAGADPGGTILSNAVPSTIDVLDLFIAEQRGRGLAETTIRNRASILRFLEVSAGRPLLDLSIYELRIYLGRKGLEDSSRRTIRAAMTAFYGFAYEEGFRLDNPTDRLAPVRVPKGKPRPFTFEQMCRMLECGAYRRTRAMILLGFYQGFRVSQIAAVHGRDIDVVSSTIRTLGKGGKEGVLPLQPVIADLSLTMPTDDWWFPARGGRGGHVQPGSVTELITEAKLRAGIRDPHLTPHSLRHSFGTELVEAGVDIRVVQELMMHEDLSSTQIYTGVSRRRMDAGIALLPAREVPLRSGRRVA
jgi:integrase/recombinase XerD